MLMRRALLLFAATGLLLAVAGPVHAGDLANCDTVGLDGVRTCEVRPSDPGTSGSTVPVSTSSKQKVTCEYLGQEIDCTTDKGTWSNARECWVELADPQPEPGSAVWEGNTEGAIYWCRPPLTGGGLLGVAVGTPVLFWAPTPPAQVNPARLAREAVERMNLRPPGVGATPLPTDEAVSLIGLPTWLWIDNADDRGWGPIARSASAGGVTVTATAKVAKVVWDMGDGQTVTCRSKGTEWTAAKGTDDSPTCGYRYSTPGKRTITATTYWLVAWSGAGQSGTITFDMTGTRVLDVVELRAVVSG